jgi:hypothetical protein
LIDGRAVSRFDVRVLAGGIVASAALAVGGGFLLADLNRPAGDLGPTAATLTDAWNVAAGAGLGLFAGSALVAVLARRGSRVPTAIATSGTACLAVVIGFSVANAPADDTLGDQVTSATAGDYQRRVEALRPPRAPAPVPHGRRGTRGAKRRHVSACSG